MKLYAVVKVHNLAERAGERKINWCKHIGFEGNQIPITETSSRT
jgi:hypothetical protein